MLRDGAHGQFRHRSHACRRSALARGFTGRAIVKFEGCYHGHGDAFLVKAGSGALRSAADIAGRAEGAGRPDADAALQRLRRRDGILRRVGDEIAGLIIEPVVGNANCLLPRDGFLQHLRDLCTQHGALLIFDEVMTGFRVALGGAQARYGITPTSACSARSSAAACRWVPTVAARAHGADRAERARSTRPARSVAIRSPWQRALRCSTWSRRRASTIALEQRTSALCDGLEAAAREAGVPFTTNRVGGMFGLFFTSEKVDTFAQAMACDAAAFNRFFHAMLDRGVYLAPSAFEAGFMSSAHGDAEIATPSPPRARHSRSPGADAMADDRILHPATLAVHAGAEPIPLPARWRHPSTSRRPSATGPAVNARRGYEYQREGNPHAGSTRSRAGHARMRRSGTGVRLRHGGDCRPARVAAIRRPHPYP